MSDTERICRSCNFPFEYHSSWELACAQHHKVIEEREKAIRERDKAIALLAKHLSHHNSLGGERGYIRLFMADNGELKPMALTCYESEVMIVFTEKGKP